MLDKQSLKIIKKLNKLCEGGNYKVFEYQQLTKDFGLKTNTIKNDLDYLKENEYIDVKYSDESVVCLCLLSKGRQVEEESNTHKYSLSSVMKMLLISGVFSGLMAFLGAFIAVLIIKWGWNVIKERKNFDGLYI